MNHLARLAMNPAESWLTPILATKSAKPPRRARSLNFTARKSAATAVATAEAISQPMMTITAKPMILGIAPSKMARAAANEVITASVQLETGAIGIVYDLHIRARIWEPNTPVAKSDSCRPYWPPILAAHNLSRNRIGKCTPRHQLTRRMTLPN